MAKSYPDDWKVIVHVKDGSRLLALSPDGEVFDTKKAAINKLIELQQQEAIDKGVWEPRTKKRR